jgi:hypothetical protein
MKYQDISNNLLNKNQTVFSANNSLTPKKYQEYLWDKTKDLEYKKGPLLRKSILNCDSIRRAQKIFLRVSDVNNTDYDKNAMETSTSLIAYYYFHSDIHENNRAMGVVKTRLCLAEKHPLTLISFYENRLRYKQKKYIKDEFNLDMQQSLISYSKEPLKTFFKNIVPQFRVSILKNCLHTFIDAPEIIKIDTLNSFKALFDTLRLKNKIGLLTTDKDEDSIINNLLRLDRPSAIQLLGKILSDKSKLELVSDKCAKTLAPSILNKELLTIVFETLSEENKLGLLDSELGIYLKKTNTFLYKTMLGEQWLSNQNNYTQEYSSESDFYEPNVFEFKPNKLTNFPNRSPNPAYLKHQDFNEMLSQLDKSKTKQEEQDNER